MQVGTASVNRSYSKHPDQSDSVDSELNYYKTKYVYKNDTTSGWLSIGFRNLEYISKSIKCHQPGSRLPNGSYFKVSCQFDPFLDFNQRGMRTPRSALNLKIYAFFTHICHIFIARHLCGNLNGIDAEIPSSRDARLPSLFLLHLAITGRQH